MNAVLSYFQIPVADTARAKIFYSGLFGWEFAPGNFPDYHMIPNSTPLGALAGGTEGSHPEVFFSVADIDDGVARVRELGGAADDPTTIPSGRFAACRDDQGTRFFLWEDAA